MRKYCILLLFGFFVNNLNADILEKLSGITETGYLAFYAYSYTFSIYFDGDDIVTGIYSDTANAVSIVGYKIVNNTMKIIIKLRTTDLVQIFFSRNLATMEINYYYLVELEEVDGKLEYYCNRVDEININGFTVNDAVIYEKTTARQGPGINWNKTIEVAKGDVVSVLHIEKKGDDEYNTYDYWYKIEANNEIHWVFGYYIDFKNRMRMVKKP